MVNLDLKIAIIRNFGSQIAASRRLRIDESKLSHFVRGHSVPNERERAVLKRALGADFFPQEGRPLTRKQPSCSGQSRIPKEANG